MRQSAVGQKCPACARMPRRARGRGRPANYVKAAGAAFAVAAVGGVVMLQIVAQIRFGLLIFSAVAGFMAGKAAAWGAQRQTQPPFPALAAGAAVAGLLAVLLLGPGVQALASPWMLLGVAAAGWFAVRGLHAG
jgi:hypothetical protein